VSDKPKLPGDPFPHEYPNTWPPIDAKLHKHSPLWVGRPQSPASKVESWVWVGGANFNATFIKDWREVYCQEIDRNRTYMVTFEQWQRWYEHGIIARAGGEQPAKD